MSFFYIGIEEQKQKEKLEIARAADKLLPFASYSHEELLEITRAVSKPPEPKNKLEALLEEKRQSNVIPFRQRKEK